MLSSAELKIESVDYLQICVGQGVQQHELDASKNSTHPNSQANLQTKKKRGRKKLRDDEENQAVDQPAIEVRSSPAISKLFNQLHVPKCALRKQLLVPGNL